ncbi:MAG: alpha/beta fold hydrolase [Myxococcales bacterium]|nr:alpha/beta fold hydrolase [Myxococcales bacterium]
MSITASWVSSVVDGWSVATVEGPGATLIWLHGLGEHAATFAPAIAHLPRHRHLLLDLPGHGGARALEAAGRAPWSRPPSIAETAAHVADLLAAHGPAVVIGHSLGGVIALALAERAPPDLRAVIDVDGNVALPDCTYSSQIAAYAEADFLAHGHAAVCDRLEAHADPIVRGYGGRMRTASPAQLWRYSHDLVDASAPETSAQRRAAVGIRYVYVAGEPGGASPRSRALLAEAGVDVRAIAPAGHWPFVDHPERFAALVTELLA